MNEAEKDAEAFRKIAENLKACRMRIENPEKKKFNCKDCKYLGDCIFAISQSVAAISIWLAFFIEGTQKYKKKREEGLLGEKAAEKKIPDIYQ